MDMEQDELREILEEFFTEADESLDNLEQDMIQLETFAENGEFDAPTVDRLFRVLHTLKGGAGFLSLEKMAKLAHAGENLLDEVRGGKVEVTKPVIDALLQTNDALRDLLQIHKDNDDPSGVDTTALVAELEQLSGGGAPSAAPASSEAAPADVAQTPAEPAQAPASADAAAAPAPAADVAINEDLLAEVLADDSLDPSKDGEEGGGETAPTAPAAPTPSPAPAAPEAAPAATDAAAAAPAGGVPINEDLLAEVLADTSLDPSKDNGEEGAAAPAAPVGPAVTKGAEPPERRKEETRRATAPERRTTAGRRQGEASETIRVEVDRIDKVMNLVGELVLARNSLIRQLGMPAAKQVLDKLDNMPFIEKNLEQLSRVTQDLQMSVLSTRMQPIKKVFDKIPRQVRELKTKLGREVDLVIEGEDTEVDKSLVEDLGDPMVHMIRNALDHGIEPPEEREAAGKPRTGTLRISAFYEGNNVVVQVAEDGKGIDPEKIKGIAISKGILTEAAAANMPDEEAVRLIMAPGFSTAEQISDVSGRGVGMDVVNSKIMKLKGVIDITSEKGKGTTFSIYLPLTLAIVQALVVESNTEGFAIPINDIAEVIKFKGEGIHKINGNDVIELRGESLPLYYLSKLTRKGFTPLQFPKEGEEGDGLSLDDLEAAVEMVDPLKPKAAMAVNTVSAKPRPKGFVVVVREGTHSMGLVVDHLIGQEEAVIKPVTKAFEFHKAIAGATITGDGTVHMILDVPYLLDAHSH